ncbi:hypothetical protein BGAL_0403g00080 [Botrytis galanthina]|uniref:Uncharacterized protein n=1 Tax=Botrytis galanthina TaxID=278940 RepID=A0A4S8QNI9_9HELO|nr:hypothetical protein BGAL_0403g00080 [Botrytis galanthina]
MTIAINKTNPLNIVGFLCSSFPRMHLQYSSSSSSSAPTFSTDPASTVQFSCSSSSPPPVTGPITVSSTSVVTGSYLVPHPLSNETIDNVLMYAGAFNKTAIALAGTALEDAKKNLASKEWTGIGVEWLRNLLGKREWRLDCVDVYIRL